MISIPKPAKIKINKRRTSANNISDTSYGGSIMKTRYYKYRCRDNGDRQQEQERSLLLPIIVQIMNLIKQTKLQAYKLLSPNDFVSINGVWEAKRDALIKILSSLPISYSWKIQINSSLEKYAQVSWYTYVLKLVLL